MNITIPETITVHLGPPNSNVPNVTVPFIDYIKNVTSSEIYPTWPENAIKANILAQISFALNRIYTEYYRTRGYNYDITNSPKYDQAYVDGRNIFENISEIVDEIFNDYVVKENEFIPYFTQYCDGRSVSCEGLSQWGTVTLANNGLSPLEILRNYYGNDIKLIENADIQNLPESYPGRPIKLADSGLYVKIIQNQLRRIRKNYPGIREIPTNTQGYFGVSTQDAVKDFQEIFNLTTDGIVGKATWYKLLYVYIAVTKLANLDSEGILIEDVSKVYNSEIKKFDTGSGVTAIQYYLSLISLFNNLVKEPTIDGVFGINTEESVKSFQQTYGLPVTGIVNEATWNKIIEVYDVIKDEIPVNNNLKPYPGEALIFGDETNNVRLIQQYLNEIAKQYPNIPSVEETGYFGPQTQNAVIAYQEEFDLPVTGVVGEVTWNSIMQTYTSIKN